MVWGCGLPIGRSSGSWFTPSSKSLGKKDPIGLDGVPSGKTVHGVKGGECERRFHTGPRQWPPGDEVDGWGQLPLIDPKSIQLGKVLGRGASGTVYKATVKGKDAAVKVIENNEGSINTTPLEMYLGRHVDHPNIMKVLGVCQNSCFPAASMASFDMLGSEVMECAPSELSFSSTSSDIFSTLTNDCTKLNSDEITETWIVMELCERGSLRQVIASGAFFSDQAREQPRVISILLTALEVASAMSHLHACGIIHGDLKSHNVMLVSSETTTKHFICKVGDFGLSRFMNMDTHISTFSCGTVSHMPPEVLKDGILTQSADVFSFGMLLWELMAGNLPFLGQSFTDMMVAIVEGYRPKLLSYFPKSYSQLLVDCWSQSRDARPSFQEIVTRLRIMLGNPSELRKVPSAIPRLSMRINRDEDSLPGAKGRLSHEGKAPGIATLISSESASTLTSCSEVSDKSEKRHAAKGTLRRNPTFYSSTEHTNQSKSVRRRSLGDWKSQSLPKAWTPKIENRAGSQDCWELADGDQGKMHVLRAQWTIVLANDAASSVIEPLQDGLRITDSPPTKLISQHRLDAPHPPPQKDCTSSWFEGLNCMSSGELGLK